MFVVVIVGRVNAELKPRRLSFLMAELSDLISLLTVIISGKREQGRSMEAIRRTDRPWRRGQATERGA